MQATQESAPMRNKTGDMVPSRYAVRVGEIDVLVISDGVLYLPTETLATNVEPAVRQAWMDRMFVPRDAFDWPLNVALVCSGRQTILIDAGLGGEYPDFPRAGLFAERLEAAGIELSALTDVVLTHLHMDHVGGLLVEGVKAQLRPDLRIHVAATEIQFWDSPDFANTSMPSAVPEVLRTVAKRFLSEYRDNLRPFDEKQEVAPGVFACRTGGHTPGHCIVRVESDGERLTFAGDAVFQVGFDQPEWHNGFEHDPEESARVRVRLLRELAASGETLVATHLPFPSVGRVAVDGGAFRWVPTIWDF